MDTKVCSKCGEDKPLDQYADDQRKKDGKYSACRECHSKLNREWRKNNKDKMKVYKKKLKTKSRPKPVEE